ncbi:formimidoylglutamase [alpha proteobacterium Q-1]|nr:formimidoylglutamase [alpha proteobacterium Q-1]
MQASKGDKGMMSDQSECRSWRSVASLLGDDPHASIALLGLPLGEKSLTPGRCDLAPSVVRKALLRLSTYDLERDLSLDHLKILDGGDLMLKAMSPAEAYQPIADRLAELAHKRDLTLVLGGNNAITRPALAGLAKARGLGLDRVGLLTLDAHFDLRDTDCGLNNGNPVQGLLDDGLPGNQIAQIGLQPFANTKRMADKARQAGIAVYPMARVMERGLAASIDAALAGLQERVDVIYVDFDIDVIARHEAPGAPGARPGGVSAHDFFAAACQIARHPKVAMVDLCEFDPALDMSDITALVAARWMAEILMGYGLRHRMVTDC